MSRVADHSLQRVLTFAVGQRLCGCVHLGHLDAVPGGLGQPLALEVDGYRVETRVGRPHALDHPATDADRRGRRSAVADRWSGIWYILSDRTDEVTGDSHT